MKKVYLLKEKERLFEVCRDFFGKIYIKNRPLIIKIGFSGSDNKFALGPNDIEPVVKAAKDLGLNPILMDTPVAPIAYHRVAEESIFGYKKTILKIFNNLNIPILPRSFIKKRYEKIIKKKGFLKLASSIISNKFGKKIKGKNIDIEICRDFTEAENVLVISHAKGHSCCGFSGAIKNLAMGMVSTKTKKDQHFFAKPKIIGNCQGCGKCAEVCPVGAITMFGGKSRIDMNKCFYCSICQIECPNKCLAPEKAIFDNLLAETATTVFKNLSKKTFFINFAMNISKKCDCVPTTKLISDDMGIFFANNPVLIDKASIDLISKLNGRNLFFEENHKDPYLQINYALEYGGFDGNYELVNL